MTTIWVDRDSGTYFTKQPIALDTWRWVGEDWDVWDNWSDDERVTYAESYGYTPSLDLPSAWASKRDAQ